MKLFQNPPTPGSAIGWETEKAVFSPPQSPGLPQNAQSAEAQPPGLGTAYNLRLSNQGALPGKQVDFQAFEANHEGFEQLMAFKGLGEAQARIPVSRAMGLLA